jgi:plastocyanin
MKKGLIIGILILVVLISGCASGPASAPNQKATPPIVTPPPPTDKAEVQIIDFSFYPAEVTIVKGGTVTWSQKDGISHTVTGSDFSSSKLNQGQTYSHTFNEAGTYDYWCTIHSSMRGKVTVI